MGYNHHITAREVAEYMESQCNGEQRAVLMREFLSRHASGMPRTTLRYAIEQLSDAERQQWMCFRSTSMI